jgi:hypothetical protein
VYYPLNNFSFIEKKSKDYQLSFLLCLINSKLINFYFSNCFIDYNIKPKYLEKIPIALPPNQQPFIDKADIMLQKNKELNELTQSFTQLLQTKFPSININNKLQQWHTLIGTDFFKE